MRRRRLMSLVSFRENAEPYYRLNGSEHTHTGYTALSVLKPKEYITISSEPKNG